MFPKKSAAPTQPAASKPKSAKKKLLLWLGIPLSLVLILLLSFVPLAGQSVASRTLDLVGAHRAALGVDNLTNPMALNYLTNFANLDPNLNNCDPLWDAYKTKPTALALAELSALPNVTSLGLEVDDEFALNNESRVYRSEDTTLLALKDIFSLRLDAGGLQDTLELAPEDRVAFLDTVFNLEADFHVIGDLEAEEEEPSAYLAINRLELTSEQGFQGDFVGGYYGIVADLDELESAEDEEELDPRLAKILETPLQDILSDETGYALTDVFCAGFERMEVGAVQSKSLGGEERRVRPITFYPKRDMVAQMIRPAGQAAEAVTQDRTLEAFLRENVELFACSDEEYAQGDTGQFNDQARYENAEECVQESLEELDEFLEEARANPLTQTPEYEQNTQEMINMVNEIPFVVQPITSYLDMRSFQVAGYDLAVVVTPEGEEPFGRLTLRLGQYKTPDVMPGLRAPTEYRPIEKLPDDFMTSSLYKGLEQELMDVFEEFNDEAEAERAAAPETEEEVFVGNRAVEFCEVAGTCESEEEVVDVCVFTDTCEAEPTETIDFSF